jgi:hypothetical protein
MARHLNGVKYPLSDSDLRDVVERVEEKFAQHFIVPVSAPVTLQVSRLESYQPNLTHAEECRCDVCVLAYLETMEKRTAEFAIQLETALAPKVEAVIVVDEEINYVD